LPALIIAGFFIIWQIAAILLGSPLLPAFTEVVLNLATSEGLFKHLFYSLLRIIIGLALSAAAGVPLGIIAGIKTEAGRFISIPAYLLHPIPKTLFIPIIVLISGIGEVSKILLVSLSLIFHIILSTRDAVRAVPEQYYTSVKALGGGKTASVRYVTIPAALPGLFSTLRVSMGIAVAVLFFAEYFGTEYGMGFYIMDARTRINFTDLYSGILALSMMMLLLFRLLSLSESLICRWRNPLRTSSLAGQ
jgi:NitT/TauT family transport system permease protein